MSQLYTDVVKTILQVRSNGVKNQIYELRTENNISQGALADKCKVSRQTINAIENNKYDPSLALAFRLAEVLGTTVDKIIFVQAVESFIIRRTFKNKKRSSSYEKRIFSYSVLVFGLGGVTDVLFSGTLVSKNPPIINRTIILRTPAFVFPVNCVVTPTNTGPIIAANFPNIL